MSQKRHGNVLIFVVMLLFALISIAALVIDMSLARLTQAQLQSVSDSSAIESAWNLENDLTGTERIETRLAASQRVVESTEFTPFNGGSTEDGDPDLGLGPRDILLVDGFDLNGDGLSDAGRTMIIGERVPGQLNFNLGNAEGGDIVTGVYDNDQVPLDLPLAPESPSSFDRGPAFVPTVDANVNSVLVRLRRTGSTDSGIDGATSGPRLPVLFGAFSHFGTGSADAFAQRSEGYAVRSESIARLMPAVSVGAPGSTGGRLPEALQLAVSAESWQTIAASAVGIETSDLQTINTESYSLGSVVPSLPSDTSLLPAVGYLSITQSIDTGGGTENRIVAFGLVHIAAPASADDDPVVTVLRRSHPQVLTDLGISIPLTGNASADLSVAVSSLSGLSITQLELMTQTASQLTDVVQAPRLVRNQRIQGGANP